MKHYKLQNRRLSRYFTQVHNYMYVLFVICTRRLMRRRMSVLFAIKLYAVCVILATLKVLKLQLLALPCSIFIASALACVTAIRTLGKLFNQSFHNFISILE